jgi:tRNA modification GTPase
MVLDDTIVALASGRHRSSGPIRRALIRVSGPAARAMIWGVSSRAQAHAGALVRLDRQAGHAQGVASPATLHLGSAGVLRVLALWRPGPGTFTGQDTLELLVPAGPVAVGAVLGAITGCDGVRAAGPGEFSARAYSSGRLTLAQAEGIAATIAAQTHSELQTARELLSGVRGELYLSWSDRLAGLLALVEAGIDFADAEGVVAVGRDELLSQLGHVASEIEAQTGARAGELAPLAQPVVVVAGPPNAGKSTLVNALCRAGGRNNAWPGAIESPFAGSTRDVLRRELSIDPPHTGRPPLLVTLCDSPGVAWSGPVARAVPMSGASEGEPSDWGPSAQSQSQHAAERAITRADLVLWCRPVDSAPGEAPWPVQQGAGPGPDGAAGRGGVVRVLTKADRGVAGQPEYGAVAVCSLTGAGLGVLKAEMYRLLCERSGCWRAEAALLPRHREALGWACRAIGRAVDLERSGAGRELVAGELREALDGIGELSGNVTPDEVLGRVFATFCIGK